MEKVHRSTAHDPGIVPVRHFSLGGAKPDLLGFTLGMTSQVALVRAAALKLFVQDPPNGGRASVLNRRTASIVTN